ncbi:MAG: hypothetical protein IPK27_01300 [Rhodanobacteraceae bacterium]|nr:hypothetical protein [Rhodanobacteraceae bacterium]
MNRIGVKELLWQRVSRLPAKVWIAAGFALLLIPALLLWLLFAVVGGAWQAGGALLGQGREALQQALPAEVAQLAAELPAADTLEALQTEAQQRVQAEVERLKAAVPASTDALQQGLAAATLPAAAEGLRQLTEQGRASADQALGSLLGPARPASDVGGEDPPGIARLPGFVRTAFARDGDTLKVSWAGPAPHAEVVAFYTGQLAAAGYSAKVLKADAGTEVVRFESGERSILLSARSAGRAGSTLDWEVH